MTYLVKIGAMIPTEKGEGWQRTRWTIFPLIVEAESAEEAVKKAKEKRWGDLVDIHSLPAQ